jgi:transposase
LNIKLHFLPPYSPNLNPIKRLWKVMNEKVRNNRLFDDILPDIGHELDA